MKPMKRTGRASARLPKYCAQRAHPFAIFISIILILLNTLVFSPIVDAKAKAKKAKAVEFGFNSVQQMTAIIADVNVTDGFILIGKEKSANKKVLTSGTIIVKVTESGPQIATLGDLVKGQKAHMWVKKKLGPNKAFQGLIITQFLGAKTLASMPAIAQFVASSSQGLENAAPSITVALSKAVAKDVKISYTVSGTATGSSTDYILSNGDLVIASGQTTDVIPLVVSNDSIQEGDETVVVTLTSATEVTLGTQKIHTYTIKDDDQSGVGFEVATSSGTESATPVNFRVILSAASAQAVSVNYTVSGTATGGGTDFTLANGTATIPAGQTNTDITATIVNDSIIETGETIIVTLSNPVGAALSANTVHTYTINDNDQPSIGFGSSTSTGAESIASTNIPVSLSVAGVSETTVAFTVTGTATGSGTDYTLANGTLTIPAGQTTANITLAVVNDTIDELNETVIITLSSPVNATLGATQVHTYTIQDNDDPTIQFSTASASGGENVTPVAIGVTLSLAPAAEVQATYTVSGTATGGGTDYTLANGTLTVPAGQISANISLAIVDDAIADPNETVIVTFTNPINATLGTTTAYTYTINDND
ncbi:hypothetical protein HZC21_03985 [Candidatus Peregrinibacteria bacterium]|nr:hypothetical protein [Candidatus Peregrinibacteria bacterium]